MTPESTSAAWTSKFHVFLGWDSREQEAYAVAEHSLQRHSSLLLDVMPLKQEALRASRIYTRPPDTNASTEFSLTRFLVPALMGYHGWALFCDCDVLFQADMAELFALGDPTKAVQVVKHPQYPLRSAMKMDGQRQYAYPRKWWSSVVLWNCSHPANRKMTSFVVNEALPSFLHRFEWLKDGEIGCLPKEWNVLVGYFDVERPKLIHYTDGIVTMPGYENDPYADEWRAERELMAVGKS